MKASEIVNKIKDVLLSTAEKEEENFNDVELKEEATQAETVVEASEEVKQEAPVQEAEELQEEDEMTHTPDHKEYEKGPVEYATKDEVAELKSMVEKLKGMMEAKEEVKAEVPEELSADEPAEAISHSPENEVGTKVGNIFSNNNQNTTYSRVLQRITNK